jgi:hypothetical protein
MRWRAHKCGKTPTEFRIRGEWPVALFWKSAVPRADRPKLDGGYIDLLAP